jgi:hypothetical protein
MEFFTGLEPLLRAFWFIAIPASIIFVIQTILTFTGSDASDGLQADFDSNFDGTDAPFQLFSFRNLINFLLGFGWSGVTLYGIIQSKALLIIIAIVIALIFVYIFFLIISQLLRLSEDDSFKLSDTLNQTAEAYVNIPGDMQGKGKILISVKGAVHELDAMTKGETIKSSSVVKIVEIVNGNVLIVEKI